MKSAKTSTTTLTKPPKTIYNVEVERRLITEHNMLLLSKELDEFDKKTTVVPVKILVNRIRLGLEVSIQVVD
jgi:hypothetical protein